MTQEAINKETNKHIKLWLMSEEQKRELTKAIDAGELTVTCEDADCRGELYVRAIDSTEIVTHFAHKPNQAAENCKHASGESPEHSLAKREVARLLQSMYPYADVSMECTVPGENLRWKERARIDVVVSFDDGRRVAHEVQLAYQKTTTAEMRTQDYIDSGYSDVVWWWGGQANRSVYIDWSVENCKQYGTIDFDYDVSFGQQGRLKSAKIQIFDTIFIKARNEFELEREALEHEIHRAKRQADRIIREANAAAQAQKRKNEERAASVNRQLADLNRREIALNKASERLIMEERRVRALKEQYRNECNQWYEQMKRVEQ